LLPRSEPVRSVVTINPCAVTYAADASWSATIALLEKSVSPSTIPGGNPVIDRPGESPMSP
jgi:hypothetical protein